METRVKQNTWTTVHLSPDRYEQFDFRARAVSGSFRKSNRNICTKLFFVYLTKNEIWTAEFIEKQFIIHKLIKYGLFYFYN